MRWGFVPEVSEQIPFRFYTATVDGICRVKMNNKMQWKSLGDVRDAIWEKVFFSASMKKGAVLHFMPSE